MTFKKPLPEPGVDVFIVVKGEKHIARISQGAPDRFALGFGQIAGARYVRTEYVDAWDYAVPASDMLI